LVKIAQMESQENGEIENEIRKMRVQELANIDNELLKNKNEKISEMEDRLKKLRDSGGKISGKEQLELGDLLNDYGKLVKDVDAELIKEREKQAAELETKLAGHRKKR
jgi:phosphopantetheine adenylyltransferase